MTVPATDHGATGQAIGHKGHPGAGTALARTIAWAAAS